LHHSHAADFAISTVFNFGFHFWLLFLALLLVHTDYLSIVSGLYLDKWHCFAVHMFDHWSWVPYFGYAFPGKRLSNRIPKKPSAVSYVTYSTQESSLPTIIKKALLCLPKANQEPATFGWVAGEDPLPW